MTDPYDGNDLDEAESAIYRGHGVSAPTGLRFIAELRAARQAGNHTKEGQRPPGVRVDSEEQ